MRTSRRKTRKSTIVLLIVAIVAVQLAIFLVWRSSGHDDARSNVEIAPASTKEAPQVATVDLEAQLTEETLEIDKPSVPDDDENIDETPLDTITDPNESDAGHAGSENGADTEDPVEDVAVDPTPDILNKNRPQPNETRRQKIARERRIAKENRAQEKFERKRAAAEAKAARLAKAKALRAAKAVATTPAKPELGKFSVSTNPNGATVTLDGVLIGQSPLRNVETTPGRHSVALSLAGYEPKVVSVRVSLGSTKSMSESMTKKNGVAVAPQDTKIPTLTVADRLPRTRRVSGNSGSASAGRGILSSRCNGCHRKNGVSSVGPRSRTSKQWDRFFSRGSHDRYRRIGGDMNSGQMANVKSYLISKAADTARNQGAGIR